ncbi:MAG: HigA family addiction module antitoxin [Rhodomicrobium sp.]
MATIGQHKETWTSNWATHPGEHLEEYLDARGLTQAQLARIAGLTPKLISEIINKKNPVSPETAIALERVLGLKAYIWTGLQANWDLFQARQRAGQTATTHEAWLSRFPIKELKTRGVLPNTQDIGVQLDRLLHFLGVGRPEAYEAKLAGLAVQHRQSKSYTSSPDHVVTWLMLGEQKAQAIDLPPFDGGKFDAAVRRIRCLTREEPHVFEPKMKALCQDAGVALVFEKPISKTRLFGSARWLDGEHAIIQMSLRMKSNDHFWWTFFHECGHIALHRGRNFADDQQAVGDGIEAEADIWAERILYGDDGLKRILAKPPRSRDAICRLAGEVELHPGIIVGMLQHHKAIPHGYLNGLKVKFDWTTEDSV